MGVTAAAAASQLPENEQKEIAGRVAAGEDIKAQEIREMVDAKRERKRKSAALQSRKPIKCQIPTQTRKKKKTRAAFMR